MLPMSASGPVGFATNVTRKGSRLYTNQLGGHRLVLFATMSAIALSLSFYIKLLSIFPGASLASIGLSCQMLDYFLSLCFRFPEEKRGDVAALASKVR